MSDEDRETQEVEELVAECLEAIERGDREAVQRVLHEHPARAEELRGRIAEARSLGLIAGIQLEDAVPKMVGPYRILERIGAGGMGEVWLAEQSEGLRRRVAIKVIKLGMDTRDVIRRFEVERQALATIDHPGVARIFDTGSVEDGRPYFVMEYVAGDPITTYCDSVQLDTHDRLELFVQVCDAVQHAHQKGIIHRDLKPTNVLVRNRGDQLEAKVIDFGVAKATHDIGLTSRTLLTEQGRVLGTPEYMSPEQAATGGRDVDTRTDIYSLGVLLYELLCGCLPHDSARLRAVGPKDWIDILQRENVKAPSARLATVSDAGEIARRRNTTPRLLARQARGDLDWIVLKSLEKEPGRRYSSAAELAADVRRHLVNEPVLASPPSNLYRLRKFVRRRAGTVLAGGTILALLLVAVGVLFRSATQERRLRKKLQETQWQYRLLEVKVQLQQAQDHPTTVLPPWPRYAPQIELWLERYGDVLERKLPEIRAALAELEDRLDDPGLAADEHRQAEFLLDSLRPVELHLSGFLAAGGLLADMRHRLEWAGQVYARSVTGPAEAWRETLAGVAADPRYAGVELKPQLGLVPIGKDPGSGLYEFAHLRSGRVPARNPQTGVLDYDAEAGIVFVLVPGGNFLMGAQAEEASGPNYDSMARGSEAPPHRRELRAVFVSKYEMSRGQWRRLAGEDPSAIPLGTAGATELLPVDSVSWNTCLFLLRRYGLRLPTEAEWEYVCRAGTTTPWWTGEDWATLEGAANLCDASYAAANPGVAVGGDWLEFDDGYARQAPVHAMQANPWGFHNLHGNVWEWCASQFDPYPGSVASIGHAAKKKPQHVRVYRGGSYALSPRAARSAMRWPAVGTARNQTIGLRPARSLQDPGNER